MTREFEQDVNLSKDAQTNRGSWDAYADEYQGRHGSQLDQREFFWGVWSVPESQLNVLGDLRGKKVLELGCGGAQLSISVALMGGIPTGIDNSSKQLEHARKHMARRGVDFELVHTPAENLPFADETFDIVFCDHGAMTFSPTLPTLKEAYRVLKRGGVFAFNMQSPLHEMCFDSKKGRVGRELIKGAFELGRLVDDGTVQFQYSHGTWIRFFVEVGFQVVDLVELKPGGGGEVRTYDFAPLDWAEKWPAENIWKLKKPL